MVVSSSFWNYDTIPRKSMIIHKVDGITTVNAKLGVLTKKSKKMDMKAIDIPIRCEIIGRVMLIWTIIR